MPCPEPARPPGAVRLASQAARAVAFGVIAMLAADRPVLAREDILRRVNVVTPASNASGVSNATNATSAQMAEIAQRAKMSLTRTAQALQQAQKMQNDARAAAQAATSTVPNGLSSGGLVPAAGAATDQTVWSGASLPFQTTSNGQTNVTITQTQQQALLNWQSFNVGKNTTLTFDQTKGGANINEWIAFNKVNASSLSSSQILGTIRSGAFDASGNFTPGGQIYIINQNGIIFGGASQVNTHALVASALPINDSLVTNGLLNNPTKQFLFSNTFSPTTPVSQFGSVEVQAGALLQSPTNTDHVGGKVALIGQKVTNAGWISTPDGQTILAAGLKVGLDQHNSQDASLRGVDVYVGSVDASNPDSGKAVNAKDALIDASRANVTIAGKEVQQLGVINSTTSVSLNGSINLLADYNAVVATDNSNPNTHYFQSAASGPVTLGPDSATQIVPELSSAETDIRTQLALASQITIRGNAIHLASNQAASKAAQPYSGALIYAPSANVSLSAGNWQQTNFVNNIYTFENDRGQVYLDAGTTIDVAGSTNVQASVAENIVKVKLTGSELANSPLQRSGALRGQTVLVDVRQNGLNNGQYWVGTPIGDATGYIKLIPRTVGELTTGGGSVNISAGGAVIMQPGSTIDVSGGWINYAGAQIQTTRLSSAGHLFDISQATPDLVYDGIYNASSSGFTRTHKRWPVSETFSSKLLSASHYEAGYIQGGNGGSVSISAPAMALDGDLHGNTVAGLYQRSSPTTIASNFANTTIASTMALILSMPNSSALSLAFVNKALTTTAGDYEPASPTPPNVYFKNGSSLPLAADYSSADFDAAARSALYAQRNKEIDLSPNLASVEGFGTFTIDNKVGAITIAEALNLPGDRSHLQRDEDGNVLTHVINSNTTLTRLSGGSIVLAAGNIDIETPVNAPGGELSFKVYDHTPYEYPAPIINPPPTPDNTDNPAHPWEYGKFTLGSGASLNTSGLLVDDRTAGGTPKMIDGGSATINSILINNSITIKGYKVDLQPGSAINSSAGASVSASGKVTYGNGGVIDIEGGIDPGYPSIGQSLNGTPSPQRGYLKLGATLNGYGSGSSLTVLAPLVQIGGSQLLNGAASSDTTLWLDPGFFSQGGFNIFSISGIGAATSHPNVFLPALLVAPNTVVAPVVQGWLLGSNAQGEEVLMPTDLPVGVRKPVNLKFYAVGMNDSFLGNLLIRGDVVLREGSVITTDPQTVSTQGVTVQAVQGYGGAVAVLGKIEAPGGTINITGAPDFPTLASDNKFPLVTVDLGPNSLLSTAGTTLLTPDTSGRGLRTGSVLGGGTITVDGNIAAQAGAILNVQGASGELDMQPSYSMGSNGNASMRARTVPTKVDSKGGAINLTGRQVLFSDAKLLGAGGGGSQGGSLSVSCEKKFLPPGNKNDPRLPSDVTMLVTQGGATLPGSLFYLPADQRSSGGPVLDSSGNAITAIGYALPGIVDINGNTIYSHFAGADPVSGNNESSLAMGGFDSLTLKGALQFQGAKNPDGTVKGISISAGKSLTIASGGISKGGFVYSNCDVTLTAPYVALGTGFTVPISKAPVSAFQDDKGAQYNYSPTYGAGTLNVNASAMIDISNLSLQNIGSANLVSGGDIRGDGTFDIAGTLNITAGQIYPPTAVSFTIAAYDFPGGSGAVNIQQSGPIPPTPLSAGGKLNIFASIIKQNGTLRAPMGMINLGWRSASSDPLDLITGKPFATTQTLTLGKGGLTSVSAIDPKTGAGLAIPYGIYDGTVWYDPTATDITKGVPTKLINLSASSIDDNGGAVIDISGGGDLYAYRWVVGTGGTKDILTSSYDPANGTYDGKSSSFAIIPNYNASIAPYAPYYTTSDSSPDLANASAKYMDPGYTSNALAVGDQIYLKASSGLAAGVYTLLPARYALLPGAFLVTPQSGAAPVARGAALRPDGSSMVSGYRFNGLKSAGNLLYSSFEVDSQSVVLARAAYENSFANSFLPQNAAAKNTSSPRLPVDAGQLVFDATQGMKIDGSLSAKPATGGLGGMVDISSSSDILIGGPGTTAAANVLLLDSKKLTDFGADSLLIGGYRQTIDNKTSVVVTTNSLTVDNAKTVDEKGVALPLSGPDVILVSNVKLTVADGAMLGKAVSQSSKIASSANAITLGNSTTAIGNTIQLNKGGTFFITAGTDIILPSGTPGGDTITPSQDGSVTFANGGTITTGIGSAAVTKVYSTGTTGSFVAGSVITSTGKCTITLKNSGILTGGANSDTAATIPVQLPNPVIQLSTPGSLISLAAGSPVVFPNGTPGGDQIISTVAMTVTLPDGSSKSISGNLPTSIAPGSTVKLAADGKIKFFSADTEGSISVVNHTAANFSATGAASGNTLAVQLNTSGVSSVTVSIDPRERVLLPAGTPGNNTLRASGNGVVGSITLPDGGVFSLVGGVNTAIPAGSSLSLLNANTTLTFASGATAGGIPLILPAASAFSTVGVSNISPVGSGDGVLLRVGNYSAAPISRSNLDSLKASTMSIGAGANIAGASITIDSTYAATLASTAVLNGSTLALGSGKISIQFPANSGSLPPDAGLVLSSGVLQNLQTSAQNISLLSYSSIDLYGTGQVGILGADGLPTLSSLTLHTAEIRGFNNDGGAASFAAQSITLDNVAGGRVPTRTLPALPPAGTTLEFVANTIQLGDNQINIDQYGTVALTASKVVNNVDTGSIILQNSGGLSVQGNLTLTTPLITGATSVNQSISAGGDLLLKTTGATSGGSPVGGLGSSLTLKGSSITDYSSIVLPSGFITMEATGVDVNGASVANNNVTIGGLLDARGQVRQFFDLSKYTSGGQIRLISDKGSVASAPGSFITVAAGSTSQGQRMGNAGSVSISAPNGTYTFADNNAISGAGGLLQGSGGTWVQGQNGTFSLDVATIGVSTIGGAPGCNLTPLESLLNAGGFTQSQTLRVRGVAGGGANDVFLEGNTTDSQVNAHTFNLSADRGSITVHGRVNAAGATGGTINLEAFGSVTLANGSELTVEGQNFDNAGKGGAISLEAGSYKGAVDSLGNPLSNTSAFVTIAANSKINLAVDTAAALGQSSGKLHLRAPQVAGHLDVQVNKIDGQITGASSIAVEGFNVYLPAGGVIDTVEALVKTDGRTFANQPNATTISSRLLLSNPAAASLVNLLHIRPGAEIDNLAGDLTLNSDWDLSTFRFGTTKAAGTAPSVGVEPGILTLRAGGSINLNGSLSDGFGDSKGTIPKVSGLPVPWTTTLLPLFADFTAQQSWTYRITAGGDFSAADFRRVSGNRGSLNLGVNDPSPVGTTTNAIVSGYYQVIRTGVGDIDISAAGNVNLLNQFATIYTAGARTPDPTMGGTFDNPILWLNYSVVGPNLVGRNAVYQAQYSQGGGNVTIAAQGDIAHQTQDGNGNLVPDSERQLPENWLYRRGSTNGGTAFVKTIFRDAASTSWWVDFSNFFEGVGALGGGNVALIAGHNISNVDAVIPTNARMPGYTDSTKTTLAAPDASKLVQLGGGDLLVVAGHNIDGGVYYVERGQGALSAGNVITTNATRSPSADASVQPQQTWLPTTMFLGGNSSFNVTAVNDVLLGPVTNVFLLPQGINNTFWQKSYFSTYGANAAVNVSSLTGAVTLRENATYPGSNDETTLLAMWLENIPTNQPWLNLNETNITPFTKVASLMPGTLYATAFSGDINIIGSTYLPDDYNSNIELGILLSPSPKGTLDLVAGGSINALQPNGFNPNGATKFTNWGAATINLSDANPANIPGIASPLGYNTTNRALAPTTGITLFSAVDSLFNETGAIQGDRNVLQIKLALHGNAPLHSNDFTPVHLYAENGDISGLTLFSGKVSEVVAGRDITDIALYIQNMNASDISVVSAGRDIIAYDASSLLRTAATASGNRLNDTKTSGDGSIIIPDSNGGDIQISGKGTLEVMAGRNLDLGTGLRLPDNVTLKNTDGTGVGIASVGNQRNPNLSFSGADGADIVVAAGIGSASSNSVGLGNGQLDFTAIINKFLDPTTGGSLATRYLLELGVMQGLLDLTDPTTGKAITDLGKYQDKTLAKVTDKGRTQGLTDTVVADLINSLGKAGDASLQIKERTAVWNALTAPSEDVLALDAFYLVLRDAGRDHNDPSSAGYKNYNAGFDAIKALFAATGNSVGDITLSSRSIETQYGGSIRMLAPGGELTLGTIIAKKGTPPGIITQYGGNISIFTRKNVDIGSERIFTLRGGSEIIWSSQGNIAAGSSATTLQTAPPTGVLVDPQSGDVRVNLAGLATGGGIGVLEMVSDVPVGDVDLYAPVGTIDAGDAGIRVSGNLSLAAATVLNASNIQVGGASSGVPVVAVPNIGGLSLATSNVTAAATGAADQATSQSHKAQQQQQQQADIPSIITVEVIGYGGGEGSE